jgi:hypothetical protein
MTDLYTTRSAAKSPLSQTADVATVTRGNDGLQERSDRCRAPDGSG